MEREISDYVRLDACLVLPHALPSYNSGRVRSFNLQKDAGLY